MTAGSLLTRIFIPFLTSFMPTVAMLKLLNGQTPRRRGEPDRMGNPTDTGGVTRYF
jgi:hypothetical protein